MTDQAEESEVDSGEAVEGCRQEETGIALQSVSHLVSHLSLWAFLRSLPCLVLSVQVVLEGKDDAVLEQGQEGDAEACQQPGVDGLQV